LVVHVEAMASAFVAKPMTGMHPLTNVCPLAGPMSTWLMRVVGLVPSLLAPTKSPTVPPAFEFTL
jgi:hypothetical protein